MKMTRNGPVRFLDYHANDSDYKKMVGAAGVVNVCNFMNYPKQEQAINSCSIRRSAPEFTDRQSVSIDHE